MKVKRNISGIEPHKFKPGQSGNPSGKPKGVEHSSTRLKRLLEFVQKAENPFTGKDEEFTVAEKMDLAMILKAQAGDVAAYREIIDRLEGKAKQPVEHSGNPNSPVKFIIDGRFKDATGDHS